MKYRFLEHTADLKIQIFGSTLNEVFENAVIALSDYLVQGNKINNSKGKVIEVMGDDKESLLYNFIDELIFLLDAEDFISSRASVLIRGNNLKAELYGDKASNYEIKHVKAATYSEMFIRKGKKQWEAQVVIDI